MIIILEHFHHSKKEAHTYKQSFLCSLHPAALVYYQELDSLKQQKLIFSQFWKPEVKNQVVSRTVPPLKALVENPSLPLWLLAASGIPWLMAASLQSLPPSSHGLLLSFMSSLLVL